MSRADRKRLAAIYRNDLKAEMAKALSDAIARGMSLQAAGRFVDECIIGMKRANPQRRAVIDQAHREFARDLSLKLEEREA